MENVMVRTKPKICLNLFNLGYVREKKGEVRMRGKDCWNCRKDLICGYIP